MAALTVCAAWFALIYTWAWRDGKLDVEAGVSETLDVILNGLNDRKIKR